MGEVTVAWFAALALVGLGLVGLGLLRRARTPVVLGGGLLLTLAGAWVLGLPGAALGAVALGFLRWGRNGSSRGSR